MNITIVYYNHARYEHHSELSGELDACAEAVEYALCHGFKGALYTFIVESEDD